MAFSRATGKHRRPSRASRTGAHLTGMAGLATVGIVGSLATPALAASSQSPQQRTTDIAGPATDTQGSPSTPATVLPQTPVQVDYLADSLAEQAHNQQDAAARDAAEAAEKAAAKDRAEQKRKAEQARKRAAERAREKAAEKAEQARTAETRAARGTSADRTAPGGFVIPVQGSYVSTPYGAGGGMWSSGTHTGVDFHAASGSSVRAVGAGEVVEAGWGGAYGNNVVIRHQDGTYTQYGHLSSVTVAPGGQVTAGQQIGVSGSTGNSNGPHLHFEARSGPEYGSDIDPVAYLRGHGVSL